MSNNRSQENLFELPALVIDGIPTTLEKMNQVNIREGLVDYLIAII